MLKEVFDRTFAYLPRYIEAVGLVLSQPIAEISARAARPALLADALLFWLVSESLVTATRFIAYNAHAAEVPYFAANFIASAGTLAMVTAAFFWAWRPFAPRLQFGAVATAVAYLWGALSPVIVVMSILITGVMRLISPEAYAGFTRAMVGCATPEMFTSFQESVAWGGSALALFGAYGFLAIAETVLLVVYFVCFLRILGRLGGITGARVWMARFVSVITLAAVVAIGAFFQFTVLQGVGHCS